MLTWTCWMFLSLFVGNGWVQCDPCTRAGCSQKLYQILGGRQADSTGDAETSRVSHCGKSPDPDARGPRPAPRSSHRQGVCWSELVQPFGPGSGVLFFKAQEDPRGWGIWKDAPCRICSHAQTAPSTLDNVRPSFSNLMSGPCFQLLFGLLIWIKPV